MTKKLRSNYLRTLFSKSLAITAFFAFTSCFAVAQTGKSLNFDGVDDYAITATDIIGTGSYTKEAWIRIPNPSTGTYNILSQSNNGSSLYVFNGHLMAGQNSSYPPQVTDPTLLTGNVWYHVAVTFDAATQEMKLYSNGALVASATSNIISTPGDPLIVGGTNVAGYVMNGDMDEARIWNIVRTQSEIASNGCYIPPSTPGLVAYYDFEQGVANGNNTAITVITDRTTNGNDATLNNFALTGTTSNFTDAVSTNCSVVPVKFALFEGKVNNAAINLHWQTATEINNAGFDVERSSNGTSGWQVIGTVAGKGNSVQLNDYTFTDNNPLSGVNYYRLNQKDLDGNSSYSKIISVAFSSASTNRLYPTMAVSKIHLDISDRSLIQTPYIIFDNNGKHVASGIIRSAQQTIDVSNLNKGIYFLKIQSGTTFKFLKQ